MAKERCRGRSVVSKRDCICASVTLKISWVIHGLDPDKRKHTFTRHVECNYCSRAYKDISKQAMRRERQTLVLGMKAVMPKIYNDHPFLKRYLKRGNAS